MERGNGDLVRGSGPDEPQWRSRRSFLHVLGGGAALVGGGLILGACGDGSGATKGGLSSQRLKLAIGSSPQTLSAVLTKGGTDYIAFNHIYDQLMQLDLNGKVIPALAASYDLSDDGKTYTFHLRKNVYFHNGTRMTAEDVKYSFDQVMDPKNANGIQGNLAPSYSRTEVVDPSTVRVKLKSPDGSFIANLGYVWVIPKAYCEQKGIKALVTHPVGTGAFSFKSFSPGSSLSLNRFDRYWGGKAGYAGLDMTFIENDSARIASLLSKQADFADTIPPQDLARVSNTSGIKLESAYSGLAFYLMFNLHPGIKGTPWTDPKVRRALIKAVDDEAIIKHVANGKGYPVAGGVDRSSTVRSTYNPGSAYDVAGAKRLLAEAGYGSGFPITLMSLTDGRFPYSKEIAEAVVGYWRAIGVQADAQIVPYDQWLLAIQSHEKIPYGAFFVDQPLNAGDPQQWFTHTLSSNHGAGHHLVDHHLDSMIDSMIPMPYNSPERNQQIKKILEYVNGQGYVLWLFTEAVSFAMTDSISWRPRQGDDVPRLNNAKPS